MESDSQSLLDKQCQKKSSVTSAKSSVESDNDLYQDLIVEDLIVKDVNEILKRKQRKGKDIVEIRDDGTVKAVDSSADNEVDEVIDICDDEDDCDPEERLKRSKCLNINCRSGDDLQPCEAMFVFLHYGMKKTKEQLVCAQCFDVALKHQEVIKINFLKHFYLSLVL